jgi:hypothetical protein
MIVLRPEPQNEADHDKGIDDARARPREL